MRNCFWVKKLLTLQCFKPSLTSPHFPLKDRCRDKDLAVISYGRENYKVGQANFRKGFHLENVQVFNKNESDKVWEYVKDCSSERLVALTWGFKVHYTFQKETGIQYGMRGQEIVFPQGFLKGFFMESDYLVFEKGIKDKGFKLMRTQLTVLNLFYSIMKEKNVCENDLICVIDQGFFTGFRRNVGKLRRFSITSVLDQDFKEDFEDFLDDNFSGKVIFLETQNSSFKEKFFNFLKTYQSITPFESSSTQVVHPELELLAYE